MLRYAHNKILPGLDGNPGVDAAWRRSNRQGFEARRFGLISMIATRMEAMKSVVIKRSVALAGHKTSVSLEDAFWKGLKEIASQRDMTLSDLIASIDNDRQYGNLSSAIRLFVLDYYRGGRASASRQAD